MSFLASCAPPVGTYNLPDHKSIKTTSFHKSKRFKDPKGIIICLISMR